MEGEFTKSVPESMHGGNRNTKLKSIATKHKEDTLLFFPTRFALDSGGANAVN